MPLIHLPPSYKKDVRNRQAAAVAAMMDAGVLKEWTKKLREVDPYLEMRRLSPRAPHHAGYYCVVRHNPDAPPTVMIVQGDDGEFVEPTSRVFEKLAEGDLRKDDGLRELQKFQADAEAAERRQREREREERVEKIADMHKAKVAPGVSMTNQGRGWKFRAGAKVPKR